MILAHKIALDPNEEQAVYFARSCGVSRFAWNWALARWQQEYALWREYRCGSKPSEASLRRELNALELELEQSGDGFDEQRFRQPRRTGDQAMAAGDEAENQLLNHVALADDDFAEFSFEAHAARLQAFKRGLFRGVFRGVHSFYFGG